MSVVCSSSAPQLYVQKQRINALVHRGENTGQLVLTSETCINAVKIDRIKPRLLEKKAHVFKNKVVVSGIIEKEIFFVDPENRVRFRDEKLPFSLAVDFPGLESDSRLEVQTHLLDAKVHFVLHPARFCLPGLLRQIVVAHLLVVVAEKRQLEVITHIDLFPRCFRPRRFSGQRVVLNNRKISYDERPLV
ncbi:DUF3794 domain-containing protein [Capillibacterium thermochitinicola]|uniref:DUF3794 domain-containing protein n=1 Tax=Capillibacterium thermochitinicola TaxID=2699427 RepID=A0A8J6I1Q3_9FIRM|nr:DUF3794 domain-containing protein [Capillibacterium thermochitinicola]